MEYHFVSDPGPRNDQRLAGNLLAKRVQRNLDKTPTTDQEASQGINLHLTEPNVIANFPVRSQLS